MRGITVNQAVWLQGTYIDIVYRETIAKLYKYACVCVCVYFNKLLLKEIISERH